MEIRKWSKQDFESCLNHRWSEKKIFIGNGNWFLRWDHKGSRARRGKRLGEVNLGESKSPVPQHGQTRKSWRYSHERPGNRTVSITGGETGSSGGGGSVIRRRSIHSFVATRTRNPRPLVLPVNGARLENTTAQLRPLLLARYSSRRSLCQPLLW